MTEGKRKNMETAKRLMNSAGLFYNGSIVGKWLGYDIFFAETEKGKEDGPGLLVDGERFRWVEYNSKEWQELMELLLAVEPE